MRNRKAILFLLLAVLALVAANLFLLDGFRKVKVSGRQLLVEGVEGISRLRIAHKGAQTVELQKTEARWRIVVPYAGSVDERTVMKFLDALAEIPISDVIADSALLRLGRTRADFSLEEPALRIELVSADGECESLGFGAKTPLGDGVYASIGGLDSVFVVPAEVLNILDVDAERFRRRTLFAVGVDSVASFCIKRGNEASLDFDRRESGWRVGESAASQQKVSDFLTKLMSATATSFVWPLGLTNETEHASAALLAGYGLDPDAAVTVTVKGTDGVDRRVSFGKEAKEDSVYALIHGGMAIVTVPAALKALAEQDSALFSDSRIFPADFRSVASFSVLDRDVLYAFARGKDGGWSIESPIVARADSEAVDALLSRTLALTASDVVPADSGVIVTLSTNIAKAVVSRTSVFGDQAPEGLRAKDVLQLDPKLVKRIVRTVEGASGPVSVVYDRERKTWNVENGAADARPDVSGIEKVLACINPLPARRIEKLKVSAADLDDYGLDKPFLTVAIDLEVDAAVRRNIIVGKKTKGGRFATVGASDAIFVIGDETLAGLSSDILGK